MLVDAFNLWVLANNKRRQQVYKAHDQCSVSPGKIDIRWNVAICQGIDRELSEEFQELCCECSLAMGLSSQF